MAALEQRLIDVDGATLEVFVGDSAAPPICQAPHPISPGTPAPALIDFGRLVRVSPRGMGNSSIAATRHDLTIDQLVDDLDAVRRHLRIDRWCLYGYSGGGEVSLRYTLRYPDAVAALILGGCPPGFRRVLDDPDSSLSPDYPEWTPLVAGRMPIEPVPGITWVQISHERWICLENGQPRSVHRSRTPEAGLADRPRVVWEEIIEYGDYSDELTRISVPALLLHGRNDDVVPIRHGKELKVKLPHAELVVFEESGHVVPNHEPEKYWNTVRRFLAAQ